MAVRKKSKRPSRKAPRRGRPSRKLSPRRKTRKAAKRSARKRVARTARKATKRKLGNGQLVPALTPAMKFIDEMAAPRCRSRIPVEVDIGGRRERGAIVDMSSSGARIVGIQMDLAPGTPLQIRYSSGTVAVAAEFVRGTDDGFAVKLLRR